MLTDRRWAALALLLIGSGCRSHTAPPAPAEQAGRAGHAGAPAAGSGGRADEPEVDSGRPDAGQPEDAGQAGDDLDAGDSPNSEIQAYFFGDIDVTQPPDVSDPPSHDRLILAFDADQRLRWLSWKKLPTIARYLGTADSEFPWQGSRHVRAATGHNFECDASVEDGSVFSSTQLQLRTHVVCGDAVDDYVESIEGTRTQAGWRVVYTLNGKRLGVAMQIRCEGEIYERPQGVRALMVGSPSIWSAPIEVISSGQRSVDFLNLRLNVDGSIRSFGFETFLRRDLAFGTNEGELPSAGQASVSPDLTVTVEEARATSTEFLMRQRAQSDSSTGADARTDYVESVSGKRVNDDLVVSYSFAGRFRSPVMFDVKAQGRLVPSLENNQVQAGAEWDGTYDCHGDTLSDDSCSSPLVRPWTLVISSSQLTIRATGYDQPEYRCDGTWTGNEFVCAWAWSRAGRQCSSNSFKVQAQAAGALTVWLSDKSGTIVCQRQ